MALRRDGGLNLTSETAAAAILSNNLFSQYCQARPAWFMRTKRAF
jgi:hypothetical protein